MEHGDILTKGGEWYVVVQILGNGFANLVNRSGVLATVREDDSEFEAFANPYRQWPFVVLPQTFFRMGDLLGVGRPSLSGAITPFQMYEEWILGEPTRSGGALYFNPRLGLRYPERVSLTCAKGQTSVIIPKLFLAVTRKAAASRFARPVVAQQKTFYDHLLADDDED